MNAFASGRTASAACKAPVRTPGHRRRVQALRFLLLPLLAFALPSRFEARAASSLSALSGNTVSAVNFDLDTDVTFIGSGHAHQKNQKFGSYDELDSSVSLLSTFQPSDKSPIWRVGLDWERFWFNPDPASTVPSALESLNLRLGADFQLTQVILGRVEALPGFYGDLQRFSSRQFNIPIELGLSYVYSDTLYFIVGAEVNYELDFPVFPAVGFLWHVNNKFTVNGILPKPDLQYQLTDNLTLHAGGFFAENTYRVNTDFGRTRGVKKLDDAIVQFDEVRFGAGLTWKLNKTLSLELEAGAVPYRRFDFNRADYKILSTNTTPYAEIAFSAKF